MVVDEVPFIHSGYSETSRWYRRLRSTWQAAFVDRGRHVPVGVEPRLTPLVEHQRAHPCGVDRPPRTGQTSSCQRVFMHGREPDAPSVRV